MTPPRHLQALIGLQKARVDFLIIGATAIDLFMPEMASVYMTADCDILIRPTIANLRGALRSLKSSGYALSVNRESLIPDVLVMKRMLEYRATTRAERKDSVPIDVLLEARGFSFQVWWAKRTEFMAGGVNLPCAALEHVLESKRLSGRKKDLSLLKLIEASHGASSSSRRSLKSKRS